MHPAMVPVLKLYGIHTRQETNDTLQSGDGGVLDKANLYKGVGRFAGRGEGA